MEGIVELVKDSASYLVISLPEHGSALGFAASKDFNGFGIDAGARFEMGQTVSATVASLPEPATGVFLLAACMPPVLAPEAPHARLCDTILLTSATLGQVKAIFRLFRSESQLVCCFRRADAPARGADSSAAGGGRAQAQAPRQGAAG